MRLRHCLITTCVEISYLKVRLSGLCELHRKGTLRRLMLRFNYRWGNLMFSTHPAPDSDGFDFNKRENLEKNSVSASRNLNYRDNHLWTIVVDTDQISKYPCPMKLKSPLEPLALRFSHISECSSSKSRFWVVEIIKYQHFDVQDIKSRNIPVRWISHHPDFLPFFLEISTHER